MQTQILKQYLINGYSVKDVGKKRFVMVKLESISKNELLKNI